MMNERSWWWRLLAWVPVVVLLLALVYVWRFSSPAAALPTPGATATPMRTLTLTGQGSVQVAPDVAWVRVSVYTEGEKAQDAVNQNSRIVEQVLQAVRRAGVAEEDLQTTRYRLQPREERDRDGRLLRRYFVVEHELTFTVRDLKAVGQVLDAALNAGANRVHQISFGVTEPQKVLQTARVQAVQDALQQAQAVAQAAGVTLDGIQSIMLGTYTSPRLDEVLAIEAAKAASEVPISPGTLEFQATVTVVFRIRE